MRRPGWTLLLVASLCLNVGFISAIAVHKINHHRSHGMPDLNLSPPVRAQIDANYAAFRTRLAVLNGELRAEREMLVALLAARDPSPEAIRVQQEKILAANDRILLAFTQHLLNQKRLLSPREQRLFFDHIQHRNTSRPKETRP